VGLIAFTRAVSPKLADCELTHVSRTPIRADVASAQHAAYEAQLAALGVDVRHVAPAPECADSVFIEDTAVVVDEVAVITRPGAESRRAETAGVADALATVRPLVHLTSPATLDGGDVMQCGRTLYVGRSDRTNEDGIAQLRAAVAPFGYTVTAVRTTGCLHLKTAVTLADDGVLLINPAWVSATDFPGFEIIEVDPAEPFAANVVRTEQGLVAAAAFPRTTARLVARGLAVFPVDVSELAKAEGAVTCCSILVRH
jgi:dimethylargininase